MPEISNQNVEVVQRLGGKHDDIIVKLFDRNGRNQKIRKQTTLPKENIYINENLTRLSKGCFWHATKAAKQKS